MSVLNRNLRAEISDRISAKEALRESRSRLQAIVDNSPTVVYLKDRQGRYLLINQQYETLFHLTKEQIIGIYEPFAIAYTIANNPPDY